MFRYAKLLYVKNWNFAQLCYAKKTFDTQEMFELLPQLKIKLQIVTFLCSLCDLVFQYSTNFVLEIIKFKASVPVNDTRQTLTKFLCKFFNFVSKAEKTDVADRLF